ncbi:MAG: dTMP kinase [Candidatus Zixiibacteriota bacterium]
MKNNNSEKITDSIWKELAGASLSPSHDRWHVDRVMQYALKLQSINGGDLDIIEAAVILHDLGRMDPNKRGEESIDQSVQLSKNVLDNLGAVLNNKKKTGVIQAIKEHDKPNHTPSSLEGKILKDADFLAGFGAWGILRIALWAGETGAGVKQILDRLEFGMRKRIDGLIFQESREIAIREYTFARLFFSLLNEPAEIAPRSSQGQYIVLEGISGTGKNTQAEGIKRRLIENKHTCEIVEEPSEYYKKYRDVWENINNGARLKDPFQMRHLMISDRLQLQKEDVIPLLDKNDYVLSVRSFISTLVYQSIKESDIYELYFMQRNIYLPDLVIIFDIDPQEAIERIKERTKRGIFETLEKMKRHRDIYLNLSQHHILGHHVKVVSASQAKERITEQCCEYIAELSR